MKLFGKMTFMSLAIILVGSLGFLSPMMVGGTVHGAGTITAPVITLTEYTPTYELGGTSFTTVIDGDDVQKSGYKLPKVSAPGATNVSVVARMSNGIYANVYQEKDSTDTYYLVTDKAGKFDIIYTATNGDNSSTSTQGITVEIVAKGITLEFDSNVEQIIPTVAYANDKIVFPKAKVMVDGELDESRANDVTLSLTANNEDKTSSLVKDTETGFYSYTIGSSDTGDFTATYSHTYAGKTIRYVKTFRVNTNQQDVKLKYSNSLNSKLQSLSLEVGVETTLPTPTVVNAEANDVEVSSETYTFVTIERVGGTASTDTRVITDYKFTPWAEGSYRITYTTRDFWGVADITASGHTCSTSVQRSGIKLTSNSLTVRAVKEYDPSETDFYKNLDLSDSQWESHDYDVKDIYYITDGAEGVKATFPAIIAKGGWGEYKNLKLERVIWKNSVSLWTLENEHKKDKETTGKDNANSEGSYWFTSEGTYEIVYNAMYVDDNGNQISGTRKSLASYKFEIVKGAQPTTPEATNLTITAPSIPTPAVLKNSNETVTFNAPTVSDDKDTRLQVSVEYKFDNYATSFPATKNSDGTYSIEIKDPEIEGLDWSQQSKITITFKVTNDNNQSKTVEKEIELLSYENDATAPTLSQSGAAEYNEDTKKINLATAKFIDQGGVATNVSLTMYVINSKGKVVDIYNGNSSASDHSATLKEFSYEPIEEGDYTFVYVATDQNGNSTTFSTTCRVDFRLGYSVSISGIETQEYGNVLDLTNVISITKNGETINISNSNVSIVTSEITEDSSEFTSLANNSMLIQVTGQGSFKLDNKGINSRIVCLSGDIYVKAWVKDNLGVCDFNNNASSLISFESKDTIAPVFTVEGEKNGSSLLGSYKYGDTTTANTHDVPWFEEGVVENGVGIDEDTFKVELKWSTATDPFKTFTIEDARAGNLSFEATQQGRIQVTYSVADLKGNTNSREFWIYIGDVLAPEIVLDNDAITAPSKIGEDCSISFDKITIKNDESLNKGTYLKINVTHNGSTVDYTYDTENSSKTGLHFTTGEAGTYVITFNVTDDAGNEATTVTKTITVKADSSTTVNSSTVWGTIMIIVSLVVVGIVIYFFVKPSKNKTKADTSKKTK